jgi:hypothetical protein
MPQLAFVRGVEFGRTRAETQKLIRSHCMLGKNKRKNKSKTSRTNATAPETEEPPRRSRKFKMWSAMASSPPLPLVRNFRVEGPSIDATTARGGYGSKYSLPVLERGPSTFSLVSFARELKKWSYELIFKGKLLRSNPPPRLS